MAEHTNKEKKKINPVLWLLFVIIIPLLVILALTVFILTIAGFNMMDWAKEKAENIPVVSSLLTDEEEKMEQLDNSQIQAQLANKDEEIEQLNQNNKDLQAKIEDLEHENAKLEANPDNTEPTVDGTENEQTEQPLKTVSGSFKDMDNKQAALIIQNMEKDTAATVLENVSAKVRGKILEAMDPKKAAELTQMIIEQEN